MKKLILIFFLIPLVACSANQQPAVDKPAEEIEYISFEEAMNSEAPKVSKTNVKIGLDSSAQEVGKLIRGEVKPPTPEEYKAQLEESSTVWFYGNGLGQTGLNLSLAVLYPPYALYLLTNAGLQVAGYSALYPIDLVPEVAKPGVERGYTEIISVPGRINAAIFDEEFKN